MGVGEKGGRRRWRELLKVVVGCCCYCQLPNCCPAVGSTGWAQAGLDGFAAGCGGVATCSGVVRKRFPWSETGTSCCVARCVVWGVSQDADGIGGI